MLLDMSNKNPRDRVLLVTDWLGLQLVQVCLALLVERALYDEIVDHRLIIIHGILQPHPVRHAT